MCEPVHINSRKDRVAGRDCAQARNAREWLGGFPTAAATPRAARRLPRRRVQPAIPVVRWTVIRPSRARCVEGRISRHRRAVSPFKEGQDAGCFHLCRRLRVQKRSSERVNVFDLPPKSAHRPTGRYVCFVPQKAAITPHRRLKQRGCALPQDQSCMIDHAFAASRPG